MMDPGQALAYLRVAILDPGMAAKITGNVVGNLKTVVPATLTTVGSFLLSELIAKRISFVEDRQPGIEDFLNTLRRSPVAPVKIATSGGGERIEPPDNLASVRRSMAENMAWQAVDSGYARAALRRTLRLKGLRL